MDKFIFDFDGVIIETEHIRFRTLQKILKEEGIIFNQELFSKFIGKKTSSFLKEFFPELSEERVQNITKKRRALNSNPAQFSLIEGIIELLTFLKRKNIELPLPLVQGEHLLNQFSNNTISVNFSQL